jgi:hypothetical protein
MAYVEDQPDDYVSLEQRFPDLMKDLDESVWESVSGVTQESATFYALPISNITQLKPKIPDPKSIKVLKVLHCNSLVSSEGIEEYESLEHLDLSLNQLESFNSESLTEVIYLNLSWNSIKQAPNLNNFLDLVTLDLSHNRIEILEPLVELGRKKNSLKEINLNDNLIADIDQVAYLAKFKFLAKIHFKDDKRKTDNPIWELSEYKQTVCTYLPALKELDGLPVNVVYKENLSTNQEQHVTFNDEPSVKISGRKSNISHEFEIKSNFYKKSSKYESPFNVQKKLEFKPIESPLTLQGKDDLIQKLYYELQYSKQENQDIEDERQEALEQLESMKGYYKKAVSAKLLT